MLWTTLIILAILLWVIYRYYKKDTSSNLDHRGYERDGIYKR